MRRPVPVRDNRPVVGADELRTAIRTNWQSGIGDCTPLPGRTNSSFWLVDLCGRRRVAKVVPATERRRFEAGLASAEWLAAAGIAIGVPLRAGDGALTVPVGAGVVALLGDVPGRPLDPDNPFDQHWWGDALARAHHALAGFDHAGLTRFHQVRPEAAHLGIEDWLRPAVTAAVEALAKLSVTDQLSYGVLHGDPGPDAFRFDLDTGRTGLIDWAAAGTGPLVYDLAAAVGHAGGPGRAGDLIDGYCAAGPVPRDEVEVALPALLRFRYAVAADHHARRIWTDERTGGGDPRADLVGLHRARDLLAGEA
jgi:homoserine kinase type II